MRKLFICLSLAAFSFTAQAKKESSSWQLSSVSEKNKYTVLFACDSPPHVGVFQKCWLTVNNTKHDNQVDDQLKAARVLLKGGMPQHHHGLPTSPTVNWSTASNRYSIEGLKFSMPGEWLLNFYIQPANEETRDSASFKFTIE